MPASAGLRHDLAGRAPTGLIRPTCRPRSRSTLALSIATTKEMLQIMTRSFLSRFPRGCARLGKIVPGAVLMSLLACVASATATTIDMNHSWEFHREDGKAVSSPDLVPAAEWSRVDLPHTARLEAREPVQPWQGISYYRKTFDATLRPGERAILRFEAAMNVADVWVNGEHVGRHLGGYLPFAFDITDKLNSRDNAIMVRIDNTDNPVTGPKPLKDLDYIQYGGLYRGVRLDVKPAVHITDEMLSATPAGGGVFVTYPKASRVEAVVRVKTEVANASREARVITLRNSLTREGQEVAGKTETIRLAAGERRHVSSDLTVRRPALWSPRSPALYRLQTSVDSNGETDSVENRIGIRRLAFRDGRLLINGERLFLRGVNRHQEYPYVGYALSDQANYRDALLIKKAGFDYVRLSHYPQSPAFMAAADELGLMVLPGIPGWQYYNSDPAFTRQVVRTCADMIRRDRNHTSVLAWECSLNETEMPSGLITQLHRTVHLEYPGDQAFSAGWKPQTYDIYLQARQHRIGNNAKLPNKPLIVSEYGDWEYFAMNAGFNQTAWADLKPSDRSSRQLLRDGETRLLQQAQNVSDAHDDNYATPAFADGYWVMFDYARGYDTALESSGIMSIDRVPKFAAQFFRSQREPQDVSPTWGGGPMVFIASFWTPASSPKVRVFSNADEVELFLNGKRIARKLNGPSRAYPHLAHPPLDFELSRFEPGELKAVAYSSGKEVATHVVRTPAEPVKLALALDDLGVEPVKGDMVFLRAVLTDAAGTIVPDNGTTVTFRADGRYEIVGAASTVTEAGIASVLVRVKGGNDMKGNVSAASELLSDTLQH
jgi:beta-galactosidase